MRDVSEGGRESAYLNENGKNEETRCDEIRVDFVGRELEERSGGLKSNASLGVASGSKAKYQRLLSSLNIERHDSPVRPTSIVPFLRQDREEQLENGSGDKSSSLGRGVDVSCTSIGE